MLVRDATDRDIPTVLDMAEAFCRVADEPFDRGHTLTNTVAIREAGFLLVAENGGNVMGMLAALPAPGLCSPELRAHEVCMWVTPGHRDGHALLLLLREFDRRAESAGIPSAQLSTLATSPPSLTKIYTRMGYAPVGSSFIKRYRSN